MEKPLLKVLEGVLRRIKGTLAARCAIHLVEKFKVCVGKNIFFDVWGVVDVAAQDQHRAHQQRHVCDRCVKWVWQWALNSP